MERKVILHPHYLPGDALAWLGRLFQHHTMMSTLIVALILGLIYAILKKRLGRGGGDVLSVALFLTFVFFFMAASVYLLATNPGYRLYHPGF